MTGVVRHLEGWKLAGLCAGSPTPDLWFADDPGGVAAAKRECAVCPVAAVCLDDALARGEAFGVLGGLTPAERRREAAARGDARPSAAGRWQHGTAAGAKAHGCHCRPCLDAAARDLAAYRQRRRWAATARGLLIPIRTLDRPVGRGLHRAWPGQLAIAWEAA